MTFNSLYMDNSVWVLAVHGLLFMVSLSVIFGAWWYRSIKFKKDQVLLDTTRLYYYYFQKTPNMTLKRVVMVLAGSFEFDKLHNQEIVERPSDNEEVPELIKMLPDLEGKHEKIPLCSPYSVKARALLHAHFNRVELAQNTLEVDKQYVLKKCPYLVNEMVTIVTKLVSRYARNAFQLMPTLETIENVMKVSQMVTQGLDQKSSPLLQLPHIRPEMLKHFSTEKRHITRIKQFISMKDMERKSLCRQLSPDEYRDVMNVCATLPHITMTIRFEDSTTVGSIVTVTVTLDRQNMEEIFEMETDDSHIPAETEQKEDAEEEQDENALVASNQENEESEVESERDDNDSEGETSAAKKEFSIETKAKENPPVHCPYFPEAKQEGWWLYVSDRRHHTLITAPVQILTLKETEEKTLKFQAPFTPGIYTYTVNLRSDSYIDFDRAQKIKLDVKKAKNSKNHPQRKMLEDKDGEKDEVSDSDYSTDGM